MAKKKTVVTNQMKEEIQRQIAEAEKPKTRVAILGTADSMQFTPWGDKDLEIFPVGSCVPHPEFKRADRILEMHHPHLWEPERGTKVPSTMYNHWNCPIYMNDDCYTNVFPKAIPYPLKDIVEHFKLLELMGIPNRELLKKWFGEEVNFREKVYFTNSMAYMIALIVYEKHLGHPWEQIEFYGVHMAGGEEYAFERSCVEYWIGHAHAAGIRTVIPDDSDLLKSAYLYGYEEEGFYTKDLTRRKKTLDESILKQTDETQESIQKLKFLEGGKNLMDFFYGRNDRRRA